MIVRYSEEEFKRAKSHDKLKIECENCQMVFWGKKKDVRYILKNPISKERKSNVNLRYCSHLCWKKHSRKMNWAEITCKQCNKLHEKKNSEIRSDNNFCSRSCSVTYNNLNKKYGIRRSKFEYWLEEKLPKKYTDYEFVFSGKKAVGSELDIYIPSLKLAFEIQGIFHYKPIFGEATLDKIQKNDIRKAKACKENGILLQYIDVSCMKDSTIKNFQKYSHLLYDVIDNIAVG